VYNPYNNGYNPYINPQRPPFIPPKPPFHPQEKKTLRHFFGFSAGGIALTVVLMQVLFVIVFSFFWASGLFVDLSQIENGYSGMSPKAYYLSYMIVYWLALFLPFAVLAFSGTLRMNFKQALPFEKPRVNPLPFILLGLGIVVVSNIANNFFVTFLDSVGFNVEIPQPPAPTDLLGRIFYISAISFAPAFIEEFIFRGVILSGLRRHGDWFAIIFSAVLFSLFHCTLMQLLFTLVLGLFFAYITIKTESVWPAIALHFINNAMSAVIDIFTVGFSEEAMGLTVLLYFFVFIILGITGLLWICLSRKIGGFNLPFEKKTYNFPQKAATAVLNAGTVLLLLVWFFLSFGWLEKLLSSLQ